MRARTMAAVMEFPVAKKGDTSIRVDLETAELLRQVCALRKMSIGEYLRTVVVPMARKDLVSEARKIVKGEKSE